MKQVSRDVGHYGNQGLGIILSFSTGMGSFKVPGSFWKVPDQAWHILANPFFALRLTEPASQPFAIAMPIATNRNG